jgi:hypothetical protein
MKHTFKTLVTRAKVLLKEDAYGITHLEDLPIETFLRMLKELPKLRCVQKLDGANLVLGVDVQGRFYTSREQKGGDRFYKVADFPKRPAYDGFKTAHAALEEAKDTIMKVLKPGMAISCEVIYGDQPNTVIYGRGGMSYVAFLEPVPGDDPTHKLDYTLAKRLTEALDGQVVNTNIDAADTTDGINFVKIPRPMKWSFSRSDVVPPEEIAKVRYKDMLDSLEKFLEQPCGGAEDIGIDMTNYEVTKDKGQKLGEVRKALNEKIRTDYMIPIKNEFLENLVRKQKPSLRSGKSDDAGFMSIEGLIFTDKETSERFKIVDRDDFTAVNKFFYQVRNRIVGRITTSNEDLSLESRGGIIGDAKVRCMRLFSIPDLEMPGQAKRALEPFKADTRQETLKKLQETVKSLNFMAIKRKMAAVMTHCMSELEDELDEFKSTVDELELQLPTGKTVKYTPEIRRRTLMTFAEGFMTVNQSLRAIRSANGFTDLFEFYLKDALDVMYPKNPQKVAVPPPPDDEQDELKDEPTDEDLPPEEEQAEAPEEEGAEGEQKPGEEE